MTLDEAQKKIAELNRLLVIEQNKTKKLEKENSSLSFELDNNKIEIKRIERSEKICKKILGLIYKEFPHLLKEVMEE